MELISTFCSAAFFIIALHFWMEEIDKARIRRIQIAKRLGELGE